MKKIIAILLLAITAPVLAQETAVNSIFHQRWTFIYDQNGNSVASENAVAGAYYRKTVFNFTSENKYEFSLDEFDAAGIKLTQVRENGTYTLAPVQFTLQPKTSETIYNPPAKQNLKSASSTSVINSTASATYNWQIERNKPATLAFLNITAIKPGFREGVFASGAKAYRNLPPPRQRSIARSL